jgi:YceI-like domain
MKRRLHLATLAAALALGLAGCAPPPRAPSPELAAVSQGAPPDFPRRDYEEAAARGQPVYRVDPAASLVAITVLRAGSLARLGHDHVVASHEVQGLVAPQAGRADLFLPLAGLTVDEAPLRAEAGMDTTPSESDIAGTRANMRDKVLEVERFPFAQVQVREVRRTAMGVTLVASITLHGVTRPVEIPAVIDMRPDTMTVAGTFDIRQSDFGMVPFAILNGAIRVEDRLGLRLRIEAHRIGASAASL